jgi:hypothetical protein
MTQTLLKVYWYPDKPEITPYTLQFSLCHYTRAQLSAVSVLLYALNNLRTEWQIFTKSYTEQF